MSGIKSPSSLVKNNAPHLANALKLFSSVRPIIIITMLAQNPDQEITVNVFKDACGDDHKTGHVSTVLKNLKEAGIVKSDKRGKEVYYVMAKFRSKSVAKVIALITGFEPFEPSDSEG